MTNIYIGGVIINYYNEIKEKLIDDEIYSKVKDYSKERHRIITYYEVGKILSEAGKHYGEDIIGKYSDRLVVEIGKKYSITLLKRMRQFYRTFQKSATLWHFSWSHYRILITIKNENKRNYYLKQCNLRSLSVRQLEEIIKSKEYERLPVETKNKLIINEEPKVQDLIKNPIIIKNNKNYEIVNEKMLQRLILEDIPSFLKELGDGFTFVDNEYKIKLGNRYNYIDILLYNIKHKCYVVIELKVTQLKKEHIGQILTYMNYIDKNLKTINEDKTIGIIICKEDNEFIMEYCSDERILSKEYQLIE